MDKIIILEGQALQLLISVAEHLAKHQDGLHSVRACVDGDSLKLKVNGGTWTPPMGELDPACREAEKRQASFVPERAEPWPFIGPPAGADRFA